MGELKLQKYCKTNVLNSCRPKVAPLKWNLHKQDEVSHYMSDGAHNVKADIEGNLWKIFFRLEKMTFGQAVKLIFFAPGFVLKNNIELLYSVL